MLAPLSHDRFEILERLGSGSFGIVYEALDRYRDRRVALKVLERASAESVARFKREFRTLAEVRHSNLASLYELLGIGDQWVLSMELIRGTELLEHLAASELQNAFVELRTPTMPVLDLDATVKLQRGKQKRVLSTIYFDQVRNAFRQLAIAIAVLHAHGIVHRDIKPSNIMITAEGRVVLLDFGLAIAIAADDSLDRRSIVGTPGYMSPEQIIASTPTAASDWYSFGVLLFQAITGRMPFSAPTPVDLVQMQVHSEPEHAGDLEGLPRDLASLADDCMRRNVSLRPSDAEVLYRIGVREFDPDRIQRRRVRQPDRIGRRREVRTLRSWISAAQRGAPRVILLHGSPGSGKSALLDLLLDQLRRETDTVVISGRCETWESVRFNAIDGLVDSLARELRRRGRPEVDAILNRAMAVSQLFPVLVPSDTAEIGEDTISVPPKGERLIAKATNELQDVLEATAGEHPLLMVLDDAQWGDYQSARMMLRLLQSPRITLLLAYRSEDWRTSLLLQTLLAAGIAAREMRLHELTRPMTARIVKRRYAEAAYRQSQGNPALLEMIAEEIANGADDPNLLLARAIARRLQRLSAPSRQLFRLLLSKDGPINDALAAGALELFESDEPLRALRAERLIRIRKTGDLQEIDVYHPRMREVLARSVGPATAVRRESQIPAALRVQ
ncbi:MAG TPA: serine/threonine-protein kinase [Thermoanaerobaculia bacterium]